MLHHQRPGEISRGEPNTVSNQSSRGPKLPNRGGVSAAIEEQDSSQDHHQAGRTDQRSARDSLIDDLGASREDTDQSQPH